MYEGGAEVETRSVPRMYVSASQLDHFLDFITSEHIIQELPFGERTLKLSSKKKNNSNQRDWKGHPRASYSTV